MNELHESWARTEIHLESAAKMVEDDLDLAGYREWLEHNELELALDELHTLGGQLSVPKVFWVHLRNAADEMRLTERVAEYEEMIRDAS